MPIMRPCRTLGASGCRGGRATFTHWECSYLKGEEDWDKVGDCIEK